MAPSPAKSVYVKSRVAVANGIEQTNPEERAIVASAQYRIQASTSSRLSLPVHLFMILKRLINSDSSPSIHVKPAMILPTLLMGDEQNAAKYDEIYAIGVTHICNLDFNARNYFEGKFVYIKLNIVDRQEENILPHFDGVNQFLEASEAIGGRVMVHCCKGTALAPAFIIAFLIAKKRKTYAEALEIVLSKRPNVQLYPSFQDQLKQYENSLLSAAK